MFSFFRIDGAKKKIIRLAREFLHRHIRFDVGVRVVVFQREVFVLEGEDVFDLWIDAHGGQWTGIAGKLQLGLFHVVRIDVGITEGMDELLGLEIANLGHHHQQEGVGGDVERHAQKDIRAALVQLQGDFTIINIELEEHMTGRQSHLVDLTHIPGAHHQSA